MPNTIRTAKPQVDVPASRMVGRPHAVEASTGDSAARIRQRFFAKTKLEDSPRPGMETPCLECVFVLREQGGMSLRRIASALGVCHQTVCRILSGKKWKHLELAVRS